MDVSFSLIPLSPILHTPIPWCSCSGCDGNQHKWTSSAFIRTQRKNAHSNSPRCQDPACANDLLYTHNENAQDMFLQRSFADADRIPSSSTRQRLTISSRLPARHATEKTSTPPSAVSAMSAAVAALAHASQPQAAPDSAEAHDSTRTLVHRAVSPPPAAADGVVAPFSAHSGAAIRRQSAEGTSSSGTFSPLPQGDGLKTMMNGAAQHHVNAFVAGKASPPPQLQTVTSGSMDAVGGGGSTSSINPHASSASSEKIWQKVRRLTDQACRVAESRNVPKLKEICKAVVASCLHHVIEEAVTSALRSRSPATANDPLAMPSRRDSMVGGGATTAGPLLGAQPSPTASDGHRTNSVSPVRIGAGGGGGGKAVGGQADDDGGVISTARRPTLLPITSTDQVQALLLSGGGTISTISPRSGSPIQPVSATFKESPELAAVGATSAFSNAAAAAAPPSPTSGGWSRPSPVASGGAAGVPKSPPPSANISRKSSIRGNAAPLLQGGAGSASIVSVTIAEWDRIEELFTAALVYVAMLGGGGGNASPPKSSPYGSMRAARRASMVAIEAGRNPPAGAIPPPAISGMLRRQSTASKFLDTLLDANLTHPSSDPQPTTTATVGSGESGSAPSSGRAGAKYKEPVPVAPPSLINGLLQAPTGINGGPSSHSSSQSHSPQHHQHNNAASTSSAAAAHLTNIQALRRQATLTGHMANVLSPNLSMMDLNNHLITSGQFGLPANESDASLEASILPSPRHTTKKFENEEADADDILGGFSVNQYVLMHSLGRGTQGEVFLAIDTNTGHNRAVKVVARPKLLFDGVGTMSVRTRVQASRKLELVQREVNIMKQCRHRNIIALYEVIDDPDHEELYLVMQYASKGALLKLDNSGHSSRVFDPATVALYARQLCAGLSYLHAHGILHRDIKPENILLGDDDTVFLSDFGVSELTGKAEQQAATAAEVAAPQALTAQESYAALHVTENRPPPGTFAFLAPELLSTKDQASAPAPQHSPSTAAGSHGGSMIGDSTAAATGSGSAPGSITFAPIDGDDATTSSHHHPPPLQPHAVGSANSNVDLMSSFADASVIDVMALVERSRQFLPSSNAAAPPPPSNSDKNGGDNNGGGEEGQTEPIISPPQATCSTLSPNAHDLPFSDLPFRSNGVRFATEDGPATTTSHGAPPSVGFGGGSETQQHQPPAALLTGSIASSQLSDDNNFSPQASPTASSSRQRPRGQSTVGQNRPVTAEVGSADVWALGVSIYVMIYGFLPWPLQTMGQYSDAVAHDELPFPDEPELPDEDTYRALLRQMLDKNPKKRLSVADAHFRFRSMVQRWDNKKSSAITVASVIGVRK